MGLNPRVYFADYYLFTYELEFVHHFMHFKEQLLVAALSRRWFDFGDCALMRDVSSAA